MRSLKHLRFFCLLLLWILALSSLRGEEDAPIQYEIKRLTFVGNRAFDESTLEELIATRETPGALSKFFYGLFGEKFGTAPQYFDDAIFRADVERIRIFYQDNGYFQAVIRDSVVFDTARARVDITFLIAENRPSVIDSIEYRGFDGLPEKVVREVIAGQLLSVGMTYRKHTVNDEIDRILRFMANVGYPNAQFDRENSTATRFLSSNNFHLVLSFVPGRRLQFGELSVVVDPPREDITEDIVLRQLDFQSGEIYSREKKVSSERNLNRLGVFETARIDALPTPESDTSGIVLVQVIVRPRDKHELNPEIAVSDENNAFNLGIGLGYTNRNFFGDARNFNARLRLRTQSIFDWNFSNVFGGAGLRDPSVLGAAELQFQLMQPYIFTRSLSGTWTFSLSAEKQSLYILPIIRNKIGLSNQFAAFTFGFLEWTLERVSVDFLEEDTTQVQATLSRRREEERPQFNSIISATLQRDKTNDIFSPSEGFFHSITVEESGILPTLLQNLQPGLPFTQFYKVTLLGRWYDDLTRTKYNILAIKLRTGYQAKYGESKRDSSIHIPLTRRFFGGGSGSLRGWKSRDLGAMPDDLLQFGGDFMFEGSAEMRINYFRGFGKLSFIELDNVWIVYFLDFGNVWADLHSFKPKDAAVAAGIGFRYETLFGPFRIDFGFRVYDPKEKSGRQWIHEKRLFGDVLGKGVLHFGIGHAF